MNSAAIIVAAGQGRRMGFDKLLAPLAGKPVLQWSLDAFLAVEAVEVIVIVTPEQRFAALDLPAAKPVLRVDGGDERFLSVRRGLEALPGPPDCVAVHDGARPLIRPAQIVECLRTAQECGAAALARRVTETLKRAGRNLLTCGTVPRDNLWVMETPQAFRFEVLRRAYDRIARGGRHFTDDVSAAEEIGVAARLIENPFPNLKITVPQDLAVAAALVKSSEPGAAAC